ADVAPEVARALDDRVGLQPDAARQGAFAALRRDRGALAGRVVGPAVVEAAQLPLGHVAPGEACAPVRAGVGEEARRAGGVAPQDEVLAEDPDADRLLARQQARLAQDVPALAQARD